MTDNLPIARPTTAITPAAVTPAPDRSLRELLAVLFRHRAKLLVTIVAVMAGAAFSVSQAPPVYTSTAKLMLRRGNERAALRQQLAPDSSLPINKDWDYEINSEIEILRSRELLARMVDHIGADTIYPATRGRLRSLLRFLSAKVKAPLRKTTSQPPVTQRYQPSPLRRSAAIQLLSECISVRAIPKSDVVEITCERPDAASSHILLELLLEIYLDMHIACRRTPEASAFFSGQTDSLKKQRKAVGERLLAQKNKMAAAAGASRESVLIERIGALERQDASLDSQRASASARIHAFEELLSPKHKRGTTRSLMCNSSAFREMQTSLAMETAALEALDAARSTVEGQLHSARGELQDLNINLVALRSLEQELDVLDRAYHRYLDNLERSRINTALEEERISSIRVIQPPTRPLVPESNKALAKLLGALLLAVFSGLGITFTAEHFDHTIWNAQQVESLLHLPNLTSIPRARRRAMARANRCLRRRSRKTEGKDYHEGHVLRTHGVPLDPFHTLRDSILLCSMQHPPDRALTIAVTSCHHGEGVSSVASNLAISFALHEPDVRVLLVRAGEAPEQRDWFGNTDRQASVIGMLQDAKGRVRVTERNLYMVDQNDASTATPPKISWPMIARRIEEDDARYAIIDLSPLAEGASAPSLSRYADTTLFVVGAEVAREETIKRGADSLLNAGATVLGTVLNDRVFHLPEWLYQRV